MCIAPFQEQHTTDNGSGSDNKHNGCMKFCFTESEREAVAALKDACDERGIEYKHLFELAKYVLVSHSSAKDSNPKAKEIRLKVALDRLQRRNRWMKKHDMNSLNRHEALIELEELYPDYFVNQYNKDKGGRVVVAHHHAFAPTDYINSSKLNLAKFLAAEQYRLDLGAADMEEARRGIALVSITDGKLTMKRALRYLRLVMKAQENLEDMHSNRIKQIYSQVPSFLSHLIGPAKKLLPKKIAQRIHVLGTMDELRPRLEEFDDTDGMTAENWATQRRAKYQETVGKLRL